jgi:hypothetical protein
MGEQMNCATKSIRAQELCPTKRCVCPQASQAELEVNDCCRLARGTPYHHILGLVVEIFPTWRQVSTMSALPSLPDATKLTPMALRPRGHFLYLCDFTHGFSVTALTFPSAMAWACCLPPKVGLSLPRIRLIPRSRHRHLISLCIYLFSREDWEQIYSTAAHLSHWFEEKKT